MDFPKQQHASYEDRRPRFYGAIWALAGVAIIVVSLRTYVRMFIRRAIGWDDYMIIFALAIHIIDAAFTTVALHYGVMLHIDDIPLQTLLKIVRWFTATEITAIVSPVLVKLSVCISILRLVTIVQKAVKRTIWVLMFILVTTGMGTFIAFLLQCIPLEKVWKPWMDGTCMDRTTTLNNLWYFYGSVCTVTDFACGIIPIYVMYQLQMDRRTKIAVSFLLGLVMLPGICSILKTIYVNETLNPDVTWAISGITLWVTLEVSLGIILASLPMLYGTVVTVYVRMSDRLKSWSSARRQLLGSDEEARELNQGSGSDESSRAKSPVPLLGKFNQPPPFPPRVKHPPLVHDPREDLVLIKSENRCMLRKDAEVYLAQKRARAMDDAETGLLQDTL